MANLKRGSKGSDVKDLQERLNALGYDCGEADGVFGSKTEAAVRRFQADNGLVVDGVAGMATQEALSARKSPAKKPDDNIGDDTPDYLEMILNHAEAITEAVKEMRGVL